MCDGFTCKIYIVQMRRAKGNSRRGGREREVKKREKGEAALEQCVESRGMPHILSVCATKCFASALPKKKGFVFHLSLTLSSLTHFAGSSAFFALLPPLSSSSSSLFTLVSSSLFSFLLDFIRQTAHIVVAVFVYLFAAAFFSFRLCLCIVASFPLSFLFSSFD